MSGNVSVEITLRGIHRPIRLCRFAVPCTAAADELLERWHARGELTDATYRDAQRVLTALSIAYDRGDRALAAST